MSSYPEMSNVAGQAGGMNAYRENFAHGGRRGGAAQEQCHFPAPPPYRCYCQPAQFHAVNGQHFASMTTAYGASRSCPRGL